MKQVRGIPRASLRVRIAAWLALLAGLAPIAAADPIDDFIAQISETRLRDQIAALEYPRFLTQHLDRASAYITLELASYGYLVVHQPVSYSQNIIARLQGTVDPDRVFVVGAHFDTVSGCPGADDNASGIAAMLEIARVAAGIHPPFSIEFVAFTLEEAYMVGSYEYVERAVAEGKNIIGMITFDMIGYTCAQSGCQQPFYNVPDCFQVDPEGINVGRYAATLVNDASVDLLDACVAAGNAYVPDLERVSMQVAGIGGCYSFTRRSDHVPFWDAGIPAIEFCDTYGGRNPYYHTPNDLLATLDLTYCRRITQLALAMLVLLDPSAVPPTPAGRNRQDLLTVYPNPSREDVHIRYGVPGPASVQIRVFDASGRMLRDLVPGRGRSGAGELLWNCTDAAGRRLPPGAYYIRLDRGREAWAKKVTLLP